MTANSQRPKRSIAKTGFYIIGISLLMQLSFLLGNAWLLQQTEFILKKEYHSREVLGHSNWAAALIAKAIESGVQFAVSGKPEMRRSYESSRAKVITELSELQNIVATDTLQKQQVQRLAKVWEDIAQIIDRLLPLSSKNAQEKIDGLSQSQDQLTELLNNAADARHKLVFEERTRVNTLYESSTAWRDTLKILLWLGAAGSVLAALFIFNQFSKQIVHRIDRMSDNVRRLENGMSLSPPIAGSDEIAEFDQTFHHMADALTEAKRQLEQSERQMMTMIDNMPVGLMVANKTGTVEFSNPTARNMYAKDPQGSELGTLLPSTSAADKKLIATTGKSDVTQFQLEDATNNKTLVLEVSKREIMIGEAEKLLLMLQDVTQKYELDRLKGEFVAVVSHDLRAPLSSIQLFLALMEEESADRLPPDLLKSLAIAKRSTSRLLNLVNDILDFARVESGNFTVRLGPASIREIVDQSVQAISDFAQKHKIAIDQECADVQIEADEERLIQVLINLIANAIKFSPDGEKIFVSATTDQSNLTISVKDNGRGIPQEHQLAIFQKYKQVEDSDSKRGKGTGLGLPICKAIIEQHGGTIGVDSSPGQGSRFWFRIPISH